MEYYNKILCVTYEELTGGEDPVIKECTLKQNIYRGRIQRVRRGGGEGSQALIVYSSLPDKYKIRFEAKYGDPIEAMKREQMTTKLTIDSNARAYYESFEYDLNGVQMHLTQELIDEYTLNASVLNVLIKEHNDRIAQSKALNNSRSDLWEILQGSCEYMRERDGHTLPANLSRLKTKISDYKKGGYPALVSGKLGNKNTLKITHEMGQQIIALKRSRVRVLTDSQIFVEINRIAGERGWKPLKSERSLSVWLSSPEVMPLWYDAVHGESAAHQRYDRKHHTALPTLRDSLWYGDGTKLNLYYQEDGEIRTINVYEVIDAATEVMLGYYIGEREDYIAQYHAFRMAVQFSKHKPNEIVYDNQGGHKKIESQGLFSKICNIHRPTAPYNGASKTIENLFYRFQSQVLHQYWNFTGQNVTTKKASSRPNLEYIEANKQQLPTLEELKNIYAEARNTWNSMPHPATGKARIDMYLESVNEATQEVGVYDFVDMFWFITDRASTFTTRGIEITVDKKKYAYEVFSAPGVPDLEWRRQNTHRQFYVQYDPYEMTSVRLLRKDKAGNMRFERIANPPIVIHRAQQEQTEEEKKFIRDMQNEVYNERVERVAAGKEIEAEHGVLPEQNGMNSPRLKGLNKEGQRQLQKRIRKYAQPPEEYQLGRKTKQISLTTFDQLEEKDIKKIAVGKI